MSRLATSISTKRPRSPEHRDTLDTQTKRVKPTPPSPSKSRPSAHPHAVTHPLLASPSANAKRDRETPRREESKSKEQRHAEREAQKEEFRVKYRRAFPEWTFFFDEDVSTPEFAVAKKRACDGLHKLDAVRVEFLLLGISGK